MCENCASKILPHSEHGRLVIDQLKCSCKCLNTIFESRGRVCPECNHRVKGVHIIGVTDDEGDDEGLFTTKDSGYNPIRTDSVFTGEGEVEPAKPVQPPKD